MKRSLNLGLVLMAFFAMQGMLHAQWSTNGSNVYYNGGNVGIGTSSPSYPFDVYNPSANSGAAIESGSSNKSEVLHFKTPTQAWGIGLNTSALGSNDFAIANQGTGTGYLVMTPSGQVGIGTTSLGSYMLDVAGGIRADSVIVNTTGADFVFRRGYHIMSLDNLGKYIEQHKHLPGIPTANEMQKGGVSVGALQTKLLQKVEELTLYVVRENEKIEQLEKENAELINEK